MIACSSNMSSSLSSTLEHSHSESFLIFLLLFRIPILNYLRRTVDSNMIMGYKVKVENFDLAKVNGQTS